MEGFPWFPFYAEDFLGSRKVKLMSDANVGRYVKLLAEEWEHGPLPTDVDGIGRLLGLDSNAIADAWGELRQCFTLTDGGWVNERLEEIRDEQLAKRKRRRRAGKKGAKARWSQQENGNANAVANGKATIESELEEEKPTKRKGALPDGWEPNDLHRQLAKREGVDVDREAENFRDHAKATGRKQLDWDAAFRTWIRKANDYGGSKARRTGTDSLPHSGGPYIPGLHGE